MANQILHHAHLDMPKICAIIDIFTILNIPENHVNPCESWFLVPRHHGNHVTVHVSGFRNPRTAIFSGLCKNLTKLNKSPKIYCNWHMISYNHIKSIGERFWAAKKDGSFLVTVLINTMSGFGRLNDSVKKQRYG